MHTATENLWKTDILHVVGRPLYAFFSNKTRKPLKLNLKLEKVCVAVSRGTPFFSMKRCFLMLKSCRSRFYRIFFSNSDAIYAVYKGWWEKMHNSVVRKKFKVNYCKNGLTNYVKQCIV